MPFQRRILHHGTSPTGTPVLLADQAIQKCWFELHRQGGCGAGEVMLANGFPQREQIEIGDWISFESAPGQRHYLGRVEERRSESPASLRLRLTGMSIELNELFPGGFGDDVDGNKPHVYAATDLFSHDPDRSHETVDSIADVRELLHKLLQEYVSGSSNIIYDSARVESPVQTTEPVSIKLRGEESVRAILKELAVRAQGASYGVDASGTFFFLNARNNLIASFQEGTDLTSMREIRDTEYLFNRILLTGDFIYDKKESAGQIARRSFRWRGNYIEPASQEQYGDRRIRIWIPWIRTQSDSISFAREFFHTYSQPTSRYLIETAAQSQIPVPWEGFIRLHDANGNQLITARIDSMRVMFDHGMTLRMELGPENPRDLWPEPPHDDRFELPDARPEGGGDVSLSSREDPSIVDPPPPPPPPPPPSFSESSESSHSSDGSSDPSSDASSDMSSEWSSNSSHPPTSSDTEETSVSSNETSNSSVEDSSVDSSEPAVSSSENATSDSVGDSSSDEPSSTETESSGVESSENEDSDSDQSSSDHGQSSSENGSDSDPQSSSAGPESSHDEDSESEQNSSMSDAPETSSDDAGSDSAPESSGGIDTSDGNDSSGGANSSDGDNGSDTGPGSLNNSFDSFSLSFPFPSWSPNDPRWDSWTSGDTSDSESESSDHSGGST